MCIPYFSRYPRPHREYNSLTKAQYLFSVSRHSHYHTGILVVEIVLKFIDIVLHVDRYLDFIIQSFGIWSYIILFGIVFCETGLVVTPFLPGDSLLFAAGALAGIGSFDVVILLAVFSSAAIIGDNVNYWIGRSLGPRIFGRFINKKHLDRTHEFYEKHGGLAVIFGRFAPIIRTFMPFVAGIGRMTYPKFLAFDIFSGILWPSIFVLSGYYFGNLPLVKQYFSLVVIVIIVISVLPICYQILRMRFDKRNNAEGQE